MSDTSATIQERPADAQPQLARVIADDAEAIAVAHALAQRLAQGAAERDRERRLPREEIEWFSQSGLWAITVPKAYGGAGVSHVTLTEVIKIVAAADASLGQLPQNHFGLIDVITLVGTDAQKRHFFAEVLSGKRFGNGFSEKGTKHVLDLKTRVRRDGDDYVVDGTKFYSTGALFAHYVPVLGLDDAQQAWLAYIPQPTPGLTVIDDWSGFGQRTTASGTVVLDAVRIPASHVLPAQRVSDVPTLNGPLSQIIQAAIDAGIAKAAIDDTLAFVRTRTRPWVDSGVERAVDDPLTIREIGRLHIQLHAADALLERAARTLDEIAAKGDVTEDDVARASVAVGEAKVLTTEVALLAGEKLFELAGTQSTLAEHNLDRHWRNARTHTLHDPVRWKYHLVGNYYLNGARPARHAWN
ncbi:SfnB family sulfur acquisition oxidoreductase [Burkholderia sp. AU42008]|uniref:SfnB family sulfur acquisition oxidoreductase n=1 Tax=unclassified Burkholderia TaxID=2613784 RepID=UPI000B7ABB5B|nr:MULTISPECIES: SfnB family sulfur acquisition oxidoreductase [unclassified Burkholderia]RQU17642.1 SfnB family sulfur acquisition oxidoreductase [Burkholderia cenocepacia]MBR8235923.1 SfnB family sulfur acquisition oxidoreductase [Burkholderia sp. AU32357]MBY4871893.1 SfnB family sulfur acquisition oxidoreductase [Burkholderia sp. AU42008]OXI37969.1 SfnB family sulfur acquisition oxidoreductase [Burkholderia sp. AU17457]OXI64768.1 SfnB family sulfur acquisition oxidoreductase [Burkholderia s